jgi:hypothetical protein
MWEETIADFNSQLYHYLEEEKELDQILSLEERLGFLTNQMEQETRLMKSLPLLFGPVSGDEGESDLEDKEAS